MSGTSFFRTKAATLKFNCFLLMHEFMLHSTRKLLQGRDNQPKWYNMQINKHVYDISNSNAEIVIVIL